MLDTGCLKRSRSKSMECWRDGLSRLVPRIGQATGATEASSSRMSEASLKIRAGSVDKGSSWKRGVDE